MNLQETRQQPLKDSIPSSENLDIDLERTSTQNLASKARNVTQEEQIRLSRLPIEEDDNDDDDDGNIDDSDDGNTDDSDDGSNNNRGSSSQASGEIE